jgi:hypothetical protein
MDLQDARKFMFGWGIKNDASVWDDNEREHLLDCLLEEYHQSKLKNIVDLDSVIKRKSSSCAYCGDSKAHPFNVGKKCPICK